MCENELNLDREDFEVTLYNRGFPSKVVGRLATWCRIINGVVGLPPTHRFRVLVILLFSEIEQFWCGEEPARKFWSMLHLNSQEAFNPFSWVIHCKMTFKIPLRELLHRHILCPQLFSLFFFLAPNIYMQILVHNAISGSWKKLSSFPSLCNL